MMGTYREQHVYQQHGEQVNHYLHLIVHTEMSRRLYCNLKGTSSSFIYMKKRSQICLRHLETLVS